MDERLQKLSDVLVRDIGLYRELLDAARAQQQAIIHSRLKELRLSIEAEETLVASMRDLEQLRVRLSAAVAHDHGVPAGEATLAVSADCSPERLPCSLLELRDDLERVVAELDFVNRGNAQLIKSSMEFLNQTMWILLQVKSRSGSNVPTGRKASPPALV